jgi:hypothetical protein
MPLYLTPPYSYIILGFFLVLLFLSRMLIRPTPRGNYSKKLNYISPSELETYRILKSILPPGYVIFPQVNLDKIFNIKSAGSHTPRNKINRKSVDFVIFEEQGLKPVIAIELDDSTHFRSDRQSRDIFVNRIFEETNFKLLRTNLAEIRDIERFKSKLLSEIYHERP